jgi:hypothetical protein
MSEIARDEERLVSGETISGARTGPRVRHAGEDSLHGTDSEACGLHADGSLDCALASAIPYPLKAIDAGGDASGSEAIGCGLTQGGAPICWGGAGVVAPVPPGPFARIEVSSTSEGACGFRADSTLSCWHYGFRAGNPLPATTPP